MKKTFALILIASLGLSACMGAMPCKKKDGMCPMKKGTEQTMPCCAGKKG